MAEPQALDLICTDFPAALDLLRGLGLRLDLIYPADDPHSALLSRDGTRVRLTSRPDLPPPSATLPDFQPEFLVTRADTQGGEGRAGMRYRDLIPSRLGGRYIVSHITIPQGGPVADWVHYHRIAVQLICVRTGWVRVVYEDQGDPFVMAAGDMVVQPPGIRHRVLESSTGLEVVEITCPALHETFADHDLALPNGKSDPNRTFEGQHFLHHITAAAPWTPWHGAEARETGVAQATAGRADARILRPGAGPAIAAPPHDGELVFGFVLDGTATLDAEGQSPLSPADAFVLPPRSSWRIIQPSETFHLLYITTGRMTSR